jgi:ketosteroid isomerase-like protein
VSRAAEVLAAAEARAAALADGDAAALVSLLHPDFHWTTHVGTHLDRAAYVERNTGGQTTWRSQTLHDPEVTVVGETAVLRAVVDDVVSTPDGDERFRMPITQVWVRTDAGWQCLAGHAGPQLAGGDVATS